MGDKRPPSELCRTQAESWLAEYSTELLNVLHVLGRLVDLEKDQAELLTEICAASTITVAELQDASATTGSDGSRKKLSSEFGDSQKLLFNDPPEASD